MLAFGLKVMKLANRVATEDEGKPCKAVQWWSVPTPVYHIFINGMGSPRSLSVYQFLQLHSICGCKAVLQWWRQCHYSMHFLPVPSKCSCALNHKKWNWFLHPSTTLTMPDFHFRANAEQLQCSMPIVFSVTLQFRPCNVTDYTLVFKVTFFHGFIQ